MGGSRAPRSYTTVQNLESNQLSNTPANITQLVLKLYFLFIIHTFEIKVKDKEIARGSWESWKHPCYYFNRISTLHVRKRLKKVCCCLVLEIVIPWEDLDKSENTTSAELPNMCIR